MKTKEELLNWFLNEINNTIDFECAFESIIIEDENTYLVNSNSIVL